MSSDRFAYIRERMKIFDLVSYNMELNPADDKAVFMWMPEHPTTPIFIEIMRLAGYNVRRAYAHNDHELAQLSEETKAHADYVIDYDGTYAGANDAHVITCKSSGHCLAQRRVFKPFLNNDVEMLCIIDLLQAELDLLFNGVNVLIDGYNERAMALGGYLYDRACNVSFDTGNPIDRLELLLNGGKVATSNAYANADMLFVTYEDDKLPEKLNKLKGECIVVNVAGRQMTKRLNDVFNEFGDSEQKLNSLYTRTRGDGAKLHLMLHGDDAAAKGFRYMSYEAMDMIYTGCAMSINAIESGIALDEQAFDERIARIKLNFIE